MSLPAGFQITSIGGQRCTAVPRSLTTLTGSVATEAAARPPTTTATTTSSSTTSTSTSTSTSTTSTNTSTSPASTTSQAAPTTLSTVTSQAVVATSPASTTSDAAASESGANSPAASIASSAAVPAASSTSASPVAPIAPAVLLSSSLAPSLAAGATALPASTGLTPTTSSSSIVANAQSEVRASATPAAGDSHATGFAAPTDSLTLPGSSATSSSTSIAHPSPAASDEAGGSTQANPGAIAGGVLGGILFVGLLAILLLFLRRRRRDRNSLLTPLTTGQRSTFFEGNEPPAGRSGRWDAKAAGIGAAFVAAVLGAGAALKSKVAGHRSETPSVNLNRGNSQFLDGPIPQHSRNNSVLSSNGSITFRDKATDWLDRFREALAFRWRMMQTKEPEDPFAAARGFNEKKAMMDNKNPPDFSQLLGMNDQELKSQAERRRASLAGGLPRLNANSLGLGRLDFGSAIADPFADPSPKSQPGWRPPNANANANPFADPGANPFADPVARPDATVPKASTYIADIRRSRGQSMDATKKNNTIFVTRPPSGITSRYPSTYAPSRDSYRDTVYSTWSTNNARKGKGRSDPFDLERPELWSSSYKSQGILNKTDSTADLVPNPLVTPQTQKQEPRPMSNSVASEFSALSRYNSHVSGVSSMDGWGDPGPDLGSGSATSSSGSSSKANPGLVNGGKPYVNPYVNGSLKETQTSGGRPEQKPDLNPGTDDAVSYMSRSSSRAGVGKAM